MRLDAIRAAFSTLPSPEGTGTLSLTDEQWADALWLALKVLNRRPQDLGRRDGLSRFHREGGDSPDQAKPERPDFSAKGKDPKKDENSDNSQRYTSLLNGVDGQNSTTAGESEPEQSEYDYRDDTQWAQVARGGSGVSGELTGPMVLPRGRAMVRALRPLARSVSASRDQRLDLRRAIDSAARTGVLLPCFAPLPERVWHLHAVIDRAGSGPLWAADLSALRRLLSTAGVFRTLTWQDLDARSDPPRWRPLPARRWGSSPPGLAGAATLCLVVSDFTAPGWSGGALTWLRERAAKGKVAVVHLLHSRLWERTAIGARLCLLQGRGAPGPGRQTQASPSWFGVEPSRAELRTTVPVLSLTADAFANWAGLWVDPPGDGCVGLLLPQPGEARADWTAEDGPTALRALSAPARRLARALAVSPLAAFSLDLIRLIRDAMAPETRQPELAEVVLSVLEPAEDDDTWQFRPGARDPLEATATRFEVIQAMEAVGNALLRSPGSGQLPFHAVLSTALSSETLTDELRHFATVSIDRLRRLGGRFKILADSLHTNRARPNEPYKGPLGFEDPAVRRKLPKLLMAFDSFASLDIYSLVVVQLQKDIRHRIQAAPTIVLATLSLVDAVCAVKDGVDDLTRLLEYLEPGSRALDKYQGFLARIGRQSQDLGRTTSTKVGPQEQSIRGRGGKHGHGTPTIDFDEERTTVAAILTGKDAATRIVTVQGRSGYGKTHLLREYGELAMNLGVRHIHISMKTATSPHAVLQRIVDAFGRGGFQRFRGIQVSGTGVQASSKETFEWYATLTRAFFNDLPRNVPSIQLLVLIDALEQADDLLSVWLSTCFFPPLRDRYPLLPVLAGRPECQIAQLIPPYLPCGHFDLNGLTFQDALDHIQAHALPIARDQLERLFVAAVGAVDIPMPPRLVIQLFSGAQRSHERPTNDHTYNPQGDL